MRVLLTFLGLVLGGMMGTIEAAPPLPVERIAFGSHVFRLETARTFPQWQQGLAGRASLETDKGMLFVFPDPQPLHFWMKDTLIPLDIIFFNADGSFNSVHKNAPPCKLPSATSSLCPTYPSQGPAQYVVELNGGTLDRLRIAPQRLTISSSL